MAAPESPARPPISACRVIIKSGQEPLGETDRRGAAAGRKRRDFRASHRETGDKHLLGEFARAGGIKLALEKEAHISRLDVEFLCDALHVITVAGKPRFEIVDPRREHGFGQGGSDDLLAGLERRLENARQILLDLQRRAQPGGEQIDRRGLDDRGGFGILCPAAFSSQAI